MTREEAIERIKMILEECTEDENAVSYVTSDDADALGMAIKALEEETIIDKIKAEIEKLEYLNIEDGSDGYDKYIEQDEVLQIIDKYRTEMEREEEREEA